MVLKIGTQAAQDLDCVGHGGLDNVNLLEAAGKRPVLLEMLLVFLVGGRAHAAEFRLLQGGLQEV